MITYSEFERFALSDYALEQKIVNVIDEQGRQIQIDSVSHFLSFSPECTIKIESMEKYNRSIYDFCNIIAKTHQHDGPVTCHVFRSFSGSHSFPTHTDPDTVYLYVVQGTKTIHMDGRYIELGVGESLLIPPNTEHKAINKHDSLMLSIGLEKFMYDKVSYELDALSENDRDL